MRYFRRIWLDLTSVNHRNVSLWAKIVWWLDGIWWWSIAHPCGILLDNIARIVHLPKVRAFKNHDFVTGPSTLGMLVLSRTTEGLFGVDLSTGDEVFEDYDLALPIEPTLAVTIALWYREDPEEFQYYSRMARRTLYRNGERVSNDHLLDSLESIS